MDFKNYHKTIEYLYGLSNLHSKLDYLIGSNSPEVFLKRMQNFLNSIGNPEKGFKFIHIGGTAGKGTTTNMVHEMIFASDKKVGSFSSPSTTSIIERIKVNELYISPADFNKIVRNLKPAIDKAYTTGLYGAPSMFEILLAIAFLYFKKQKCEYVILEVGLGGRYDATNIITNPLVTAITCIDYDHTEILGKTLSKIANDKAGIIKNNSLFFTTESRPSVLNIFKKICRAKNTKFAYIKCDDNHNTKNFKLASAIAHTIGIDKKSINIGSKKCKLPCRFEIISKKPFIILDGAHNKSKIKATISNLNSIHYNKLFLIIGIAGNKDSKKILKEIIPNAHCVYITHFQNTERKATHPITLAKIAKKYLSNNSKLNIFLDPNDALSNAIKMAGPNDAILVTGSFMLAGELRSRWYPEKNVLKNRTSF